MTNREAINWIINISADIGKSEHRDLWHYEQALYEIRDMLEDVPDTNVGDTISRQSAIDALHGYFDGMLETDTWSPCDVYGLIEILPSSQPEPHWIPCSERLPEHGGRYLISVLDGINRRTTVAPYLPRCKAWAMNGRMAYWKVIAWLPLPEPYREEEQDG